MTGTTAIKTHYKRKYSIDIKQINELNYFSNAVLQSRNYYRPLHYKHIQSTNPTQTRKRILTHSHQMKLIFRVRNPQKAF